MMQLLHTNFMKILHFRVLQKFIVNMDIVLTSLKLVSQVAEMMQTEKQFLIV